MSSSITPSEFTTPLTSTPVPLSVSGNDATQPTSTVRVLHVINGEHFSGAERVQQHLGLQLGQFGFDPVFACVKPDKFPKCAGLPPHQIVETPMSSRFDFGVADKLSQLVEEEAISILHAHTPRTALVTSLAAKKTGTPWVYHVHSPTSRDSVRGIGNRLNSVIERYSIRNCDLLMTVSKSLRREMLRLRVPRKKLCVVANGVPALEAIEPTKRLHRDRWTLGLVALMRPRKGVEIALEALRILREQDQPLSMKFIGPFETAEYEAEVMDLQSRLGVGDCVEWTGFTNDVPAAIHDLDGLLLPSLFGEGMPMVVLEAISSGIPVVATRVEGTPEVIRDGREGFLAEPRDAQSFADAIMKLISDRRRWAKLSEQALGRHRAHFSDIRMAQRVAAGYARILD